MTRGFAPLRPSAVPAEEDHTRFVDGSPPLEAAQRMPRQVKGPYESGGLLGRTGLRRIGERAERVRHGGEVVDGDSPKEVMVDSVVGVGQDHPRTY